MKIYQSRDADTIAFIFPGTMEFSEGQQTRDLAFLKADDKVGQKGGSFRRYGIENVCSDVFHG